MSALVGGTCSETRVYNIRIRNCERQLSTVSAWPPLASRRRSTAFTVDSGEVGRYVALVVNFGNTVQKGTAVEVKPVYNKGLEWNTVASL